MAAEYIDVIDTAVKIGLGALISGVTTYIITNRNYQHEHNKNRLKRKSDLLIVCAEHLDSYFHAQQDFLSVVDGLLRNGDKPGPLSTANYNYLFEVDEKSIAARVDEHKARSRLKLIGANYAVEQLEKIANLEMDYRHPIIFDHRLITAEETKKFRKAHKILQKTVHEALAAELDKC